MYLILFFNVFIRQIGMVGLEPTYNDMAYKATATTSLATSRFLYVSSDLLLISFHHF